MYSVRDKKCGHSPIVKRDIIATIISKIDRPKKNPSSTNERVQRALQSDILNENKRGHETGHERNIWSDIKIAGSEAFPNWF